MKYTHTHPYPLNNFQIRKREVKNILKIAYVVVVRLLSHAQLFVTWWTAAHQTPLSSTVSWCLLKFMSSESVTLYDHLILFHPLLLTHHPLLPSIFLNIRVFSSGLALHVMWPKIGASVLVMVFPMNIQGRFPLGLTGLISLLSRGLSRVLSSTSSKASVFRCSAFFMFQLSHLYMTIGKAITLTIWPLSTKWCLSFLICCLGLSSLFFQGASIF